MRPLLEGWRWTKDGFDYKDEWYEDDITSGLTDQARTTRELVKAMSDIVQFLQFEGEEAGMFENYRLPTLDAELWVCETTGLVKHSFFEKETCPNKVLQKDTALSEMSVRASLTQEVVRRMTSAWMRDIKFCRPLRKNSSTVVTVK